MGGKWEKNIKIMYNYQDLIDFFKFNPVIQQALIDEHPLVLDAPSERMSEIIGKSFDWDNTSQGWHFWKRVHTSLFDLERVELPVNTAIPYDDGQESKWLNASKYAYEELLDQCVSITICSPGGYSPEKMQIRNERMVNDCDLVLALWDGSPGGTGNCVEYAKRTGRPLLNLWEYWESGKSASRAINDYLNTRL